MGELKETWKKTGKGLGNAFKDLGLSVFKTAKNVVNKIDAAVEREDQKKEEADGEPACEKAEKDKK